ncbi:MAG: hypothetical protein ACXWJD_10340 [Burkholderiaceae bacterium]
MLALMSNDPNAEIRLIQPHTRQTIASILIVPVGGRPVKNCSLDQFGVGVDGFSHTLSLLAEIMLAWQ